jgi:hypothetical protein
MKLDSLSPSLVFFLAGVAASAAVNFLIDSATNTYGSLRRESVIASGVAWLVASLGLTLAGMSLEDARRETDRRSSADQSPEEYAEVWRLSLAPVSRRLGVFVALTVVMAILAVLVLSIR